MVVNCWAACPYVRNWKERQRRCRGTRPEPAPCGEGISATCWQPPSRPPAAASTCCDGSGTRSSPASRSDAGMRPSPLARSWTGSASCQTWTPAGTPDFARTPCGSSSFAVCVCHRRHRRPHWTGPWRNCRPRGRLPRCHRLDDRPLLPRRRSPGGLDSIVSGSLDQHLLAPCPARPDRCR